LRGCESGPFLKDITMNTDEIKNLIREEFKELIRECIYDAFLYQDEFSAVNRLHDKVDQLLDQKDLEDKVDGYMEICDKFEDYMKNVDKINQMINEFKGLVAIVRGKTAVQINAKKVEE
jgi:predicted Ser/Thr protein kinase